MPDNASWALATRRGQRRRGPRRGRHGQLSAGEKLVGLGLASPDEAGDGDGCERWDRRAQWPRAAVPSADELERRTLVSRRSLDP